MDSFYKGMTPEEYNSLLQDGEELYVPDHMAIIFFNLDKAAPLGIPATAHLETGSGVLKMWQLTPEPDNIAALWSYAIVPSRHGRPQVLRAPNNNTGLYYACGVDELHTVREEVAFKLLMRDFVLSGDKSGEG